MQNLYQSPPDHHVVLEKTPPSGMLASLGIRKGSKVDIVCRQPLSGPIIVKLDGRDIAISREIAEQILVREAV